MLASILAPNNGFWDPYLGMEIISIVISPCETMESDRILVLLFVVPIFVFSAEIASANVFCLSFSLA